ncbi:DEAD/DEAH box helicase [Acinetobacter sp.]|uniref:DEAD/DEAH box helicase n=1 Tax=Acinetobacter sp. TaxID=472 RepID=UPI0031E16D37
MNEKLNSLKQISEFNATIGKLTLNKFLEDDELSFLLACAIVFLKDYHNDQRKTQHLNFAYFIVLKVAINNNYYIPLMDVSLNLGLYPIVRYIMKNNMNENISITDVILDSRIEEFKKGEIIETYKQKTYRESILKSNYNECCYIAPTSFGKSSLIIEILSQRKSDKVAIIVPSKSLLLQTYKNIKNNTDNKKIIFHDEMYNSSMSSFVAVLTQERALRMLNKYKGLSFDNLIIDEAHNLLDNDYRSLLLSRVIRRNKFRNKNTKIFYLSPLIEDSKNLKFDDEQFIFEKKISFNFKEPDISEYKKSGEIFKYNRFVDEFYYSESISNYIDYIFLKSKNKNFIFLIQPRKIEKLAEKICDKLNVVFDDYDLIELSEIISKNVHEEFYCVDYIRKGLIYLHGKLPDLIKEYLEFKFSQIKNIRYLVANTVILEGVNLPIDNLFIMNTWGLKGKELTNLIGRVNRLNEVFNNKSKSLDKLNPTIHFINSDDFGSKKGNMSNKIKLLKSSLVVDEVRNPVLLNYDKNITSDDSGGEGSGDYLFAEVNLVKEREDFLIYNENDYNVKLKHVLVESGLDSEYSDFELAYSLLKHRIEKINTDENWIVADIVDKIYLFFIKELESNLKNKELSRLEKIQARNFYKMFIERLHILNLRDHIQKMLKYFYLIKDDLEDRYFYVGRSYGEIEHPNEMYISYNSKNYIDLSKKSHKELVNIALIKIKIESDFVAYSLNKFVNVLFELSLIDEAEYNMFMYGTESRKYNEFIQLGLSSSLINFLIRENQIDNLFIDKYGYLNYRNSFIDFISQQDDLVQFEISKFITMRN